MSANAGSGGLLHPVAQAFRGFSRYLQGVMAVSYTHLTLPTILLV